MWMDSSDLHLLHSAVSLCGIEHNFPDEPSVTSLPLPGCHAVIYLSFSCLPCVEPLATGQMVLLFAITTGSLLWFLYSAMIFMFIFGTEIIALLLPALGCLYSAINQIYSITAYLIVLLYFTIFVSSLNVVILEIEHLSASLVSQIIPPWWPSSFPLDAHFSFWCSLDAPLSLRLSGGIVTHRNSYFSALCFCNTFTYC